MTTKVLEALRKTEEAGATTAAKLALVKGALVKGAKEEGGKVVLNLEQLEPALETKVRKWYHELNVAMGEFSKSGLRIGQILLEARAELKPLGIWIAFLNRIPGLSAKTGDRFIKRYEMAQKKLTSSVLAVATTAGINLSGESEKEPFGRYSKAVKKVGNPPKETGKMDEDFDRAQSWVAQVLNSYNSQLKRARARQEEVDPVERAAERLIAAVQSYNEDREAQVGFLRRVLMKVTKELGYREVLVAQSSRHFKAA